MRKQWMKRGTLLAAVLLAGAAMSLSAEAAEGMEQTVETVVTETVAAQSEVIMGTLGDNNGISYSYNTETKVLTVTGEDSGNWVINGFYSKFTDICSDVETIIMHDCTIQGDASYLFAGLTELSKIRFENFDTSQVTDMGCMFFGCCSLTSLDLSGFNTSQVTSMHDMFYRCSSLKSLDLSSFDTSQVTDMCVMFGECSSLTELDLSSFNFCRWQR